MLLLALAAAFAAAFAAALVACVAVLVVEGSRYGRDIVPQGGYPVRRFWQGGLPLLYNVVVNGMNGVVGRFIPPAHDTPFLNWHTMVPQAALLQHHWRAIREEALAVFQHAPRFETIDLVERDLAAGDVTPADRAAGNTKPWRAFVFKFHKGWNEANCAACPQTAALLKSIPAIKLAMFSIFAPGKRLVPHTGFWRGVARLHLGLVVPQVGQQEQRAAAQAGRETRPVLMVAGKRYYWREGELMLFDDTFMHEAWNPTDAWRIVLICDIDRPDVPRWLSVFKHVLGGAYLANVNARAEAAAAAR